MVGDKGNNILGPCWLGTLNGSPASFLCRIALTTTWLGQSLRGNEAIDLSCVPGHLSVVGCSYYILHAVLTSR